ncbi:HAMP domain-containing protein [Klenkia marina]|uniref:HAMP domain-containing protein n=1 Tax=Klenkia marina TaxID=1960309 RepID=A0A1G4YUG2_9ACTN|nr:SpoIIE family protein phosphatase [Klenkia marina]SCX56548.1 HAMP domain-containing protein [Klenkia marina]
MRQHGLARWVLALTVVLVGLAVAAGAALWSTETQVQRTQQHRDDLAQVARIEAQLLTGYVDEETGLRGYLLTADPDFLAPYERAAEITPLLTTDLRSAWEQAGGPVDLVEELEAAHDTWVDHARAQIALVGQAGTEAASTVEQTQQGKVYFDAIRDAERTAADWVTAAGDRAADRLATLQGRMTWLLGGTLSTLLVVLVAGSLVLWRAVVRPLGRLAAATRAVAAGDLAAVLPVTGAPEMRSLAGDVTAMRDRLAADLHGTQRALDALAQTGPAVSALRAALEPVGGQVVGTTVAGRLDPAEGVLAGDWFDTVALTPNRLGVVVGDVAGHGPASAVFALRLKHSLLTALRAGLDPGEALGAVCSDLADAPAGQFATAFVAVLDVADGVVRHANAGHPAGQLVDAGGGWTELAPTGPLLSSVFTGRRWRTTTTGLDAGDVLLVHTDGVTEARDPAGVEFGTEGIRRAVQEIGTDDPQRVVDAVAATSMRFGGNRSRRDDHTVVCVLRSGVVPEARAAVEDLPGSLAR